MIFYHVSTDLYHDGIFVPRIPVCRHQQSEDNRIPRICVAPTIEDCLTAIPGGGSWMDELYVQQRGYFLIFRIDTEKLNIHEKHIISSEELHKKDWVRDAEVTKEIWITCPFVVPPEDQMMVKIDRWDEEAEDVFPYCVYEMEEDYEGDFCQAYWDLFGEEPPCATRIVNVKYTPSTLHQENEIDLYIEHPYEMEALENYLIHATELEIKEKSLDRLTLRAKMDTDLRNLFFYHQSLIHNPFIYLNRKGREQDEMCID